MRRKFLNWEQYQKNMKPEEELTFSKESPFSPITKSPEVVFFAWHGSMNLVAKGISGTLYICREGIGDPVAFNFDVLPIFLSEDMKRIEMTNQKQEYHWTEKIPDFIEEQAPNWVLEEAQKIIDNKKNRKADE